MVSVGLWKTIPLLAQHAAAGQAGHDYTQTTVFVKSQVSRNGIIKPPCTSWSLVLTAPTNIRSPFTSRLDQQPFFGYAR